MPDQIPGFTLERVLGWGAMGVVYLARQQSPERLVALKMLRSGSFSDLWAQGQFRDEANTIAGLNHPHIVQIFQVIMDQGQPILVLEHCEGGSLEQELRDHLPTPTEAATLVRILAETMQTVHHANVIHRDLKPGNILLTRNGTPKITDFGLARSATPSESLLGRVAGTPSYMAPEQAEGRADIGVATDIYALGAVLYECLTGRPPFKGSSVPETLRQVVNDEPVPVRTLMPGVPRDLETIVHRCLHKEPGGRYATAQDLADDLGRFLRGEAIHARPVSWLERTVRWTLLHKALAGLIGVSGLALVVVLALAFYFTATLSAERTRSEQAEKEAQTRQFFALRSQAVERASS